jgi:hypothetical protein
LIAIIGNTYATASVGLKVLLARYVTLRNQVETWIRQSVFEPIFRIHKIYVQSAANIEHKIRTEYSRQLNLPRLRWDNAYLSEDKEEIKFIQSLVEKNMLPRTAIYHALGLDEKAVERDLIEQDKKDAMREKQKSVLKKTKELPGAEGAAGGAPVGGPEGMPPELGESMGGELPMPAGAAPAPEGFPSPEEIESLGEEGA